MRVLGRANTEKALCMRKAIDEEERDRSTVRERSPIDFREDKSGVGSSSNPISASSSSAALEAEDDRGETIEEPKKKRAMVRKACASCRRAHASCCPDRPCRRCESRGLICTDEDQVSDATSGAPLYTPSFILPSHSVHGPLDPLFGYMQHRQRSFADLSKWQSMSSVPMLRAAASADRGCDSHDAPSTGSLQSQLFSILQNTFGPPLRNHVENPFPDAQKRPGFPTTHASAATPTTMAKSHPLMATQSATEEKMRVLQSMIGGNGSSGFLSNLCPEIDAMLSSSVERGIVESLSFAVGTCMWEQFLLNNLDIFGRRHSTSVLPDKTSSLESVADAQSSSSSDGPSMIQSMIPGIITATASSSVQAGPLHSTVAPNLADHPSYFSSHVERSLSFLQLERVCRYASTMVVCWEADMRTTYVNEVVESITGRSRADFVNEAMLLAKYLPESAIDEAFRISFKCSVDPAVSMLFSVSRGFLDRYWVSIVAFCRDGTTGLCLCGIACMFPLDDRQFDSDDLRKSWEKTLPVYSIVKFSDLPLRMMGLV
eukprot:ANDGO_01689.mRNA.1 hypothetical protein